MTYLYNVNNRYTNATSHILLQQDHKQQTKHQLSHNQNVLQTIIRGFHYHKF